MSEQRYEFRQPVEVLWGDTWSKGVVLQCDAGEEPCVFCRIHVEAGSLMTLSRWFKTEHVKPDPDFALTPIAPPVAEPAPDIEAEAAALPTCCCNSPRTPFGMDAAEYGWAECRTSNTLLDMVAGVAEEWVPDRYKTVVFAALQAAQHRPAGVGGPAKQTA